MTVFKCANICYETESFGYLRFVKSLILSASNSVYLTATITSSNDWVFEDTGTTVKNVDISAGSNKYDFKFKYTGSMPTSSTKYIINVKFDYYSDSTRVNLLKTNSHTFEFHFYHYNDFSSYIYDHCGFDGSCSLDNGNITLSCSTGGYESPLVEGTASRYVVYTYGNVGHVTIQDIPSDKFVIFSYRTYETYYSGGIFVDGARVFYYSDNSVRKFVYYGCNEVKLISWEKRIYIDGLYIMNKIT